MFKNINIRFPYRVVMLWLLSVATVTAVVAQTKRNTLYDDYIDKYKDLAIQQMLAYHIPASITLAQGLIESGAGRSRLARDGNNHFGIKCHGWDGPTIPEDDDAPKECFRAYNSAYDSYVDHSQFLANNPRYSRLFTYEATDYKRWAYGLKECGYATNPNYPTLLINVIELYELQRFDKAKHYDKSLHETNDRDAVGRDVYKFNGNYYVQARQDETFSSIGEEFGISYKKLAKVNELPRDYVLSDGDIVYLKAKGKKAPKEYKGHIHTVSEGESMHSIAQAYGIKVKYLYRINRLPEDHQLSVGDQLKVR